MAIGIASADEKFAESIASMLHRMSYIDNCDTLGQRANDSNIHEVM
jgi:hypothetical protein